jgi:hypothetical protein
MDTTIDIDSLPSFVYTLKKHVNKNTNAPNISFETYEEMLMDMNGISLDELIDFLNIVADYYSIPENDFLNKEPHLYSFIKALFKITKYIPRLKKLYGYKISRNDLFDNLLNTINKM